MTTSAGFAAAASRMVFAADPALGPTRASRCLCAGGCMPLVIGDRLRRSCPPVPRSSVEGRVGPGARSCGIGFSPCSTDRVHGAVDLPGRRRDASVRGGGKGGKNRQDDRSGSDGPHGGFSGCGSYADRRQAAGQVVSRAARSGVNTASLSSTGSGAGASCSLSLACGSSRNCFKPSAAVGRSSGLPASVASGHGGNREQAEHGHTEKWLHGCPPLS